jgi:hypothetical protein
MGCASTAAKRTDKGLELDLLSEKNKGFVVLKVVSTRPISVFNPKWESIKISGNGMGEDLMDVTPTWNMFIGGPIPTESLYFAKLDAGEYKVTGMGSNGPGTGLLMVALTSDSTSFSEGLPKFNVVPDRLTNLGTVVYAPEIDKEHPEQLLLLAGPQGKQAAKNALLAEAKRAEIPLMEGGGWMITPPNEADVLKKARPLVSMMTFKNTKDGLLAASHLGQLLRRTGPGQWRSEPLDTLDRVFSLAETSDGRLIAGGEYGEYFVKDRASAWKAFRVGNENGKVTTIVPRPMGGTYFVVMNGLTTRVLLKKSYESETEVPVEILQLNDYSSNYLVTDNEIIFARNIPGITREVVFNRVDMRTMATTSKSENFFLMGWQYLPGGHVKVVRQNGLSNYNTTSEDGFQTFVHSETPGVFGSYWLDRENGLSIEPTNGIITVSNKLRKTSDGGKTWATYGNPLETRMYSGQIVFADDDEVLIQGSHMVYSTLNKGATWKRVFPND